MKIASFYAVGALIMLISAKVSAAPPNQGCIEGICIGMTRAEILTEFAKEIRAGAKYKVRDFGLVNRPYPVLSLQLDDVRTDNGTRSISADIPREGGKTFYIFSSTIDLGELDVDEVDHLLRSTYGQPSSSQRDSGTKGDMGHLVYCWGENCPVGYVLMSSATLTESPANTEGIKIMAHVELSYNGLEPLSLSVFSYDPALKTTYDAATLKWSADLAAEWERKSSSTRQRKKPN